MVTRIVLADEHQVIRQGLRTLLDNEADFAVVAETGTGEAALQAVLETKPDVVILDLVSTDLKGIEAVQRLVTAVPAVRVIGLSMFGDRRFVVEMLKAGAFGYVLKDNAFEELAMAIRAVRAHKTYISRALSDSVIQDYIDLLRFSETRFRKIFASSTIGIALVDQKCQIVESNPALQDFLGFDQDELNNRTLAEFVHPEPDFECRELFQELVAGNRRSFQIEHQYKRKDGHLEWGRLSVSPFGAPDNGGQFAIVMLEDIGQQREAGTKIQEYQEKLRSVALELSLTEEAERRRLATDLNDHVGQILALAQIKLGALRESAATSQHGPLDEVRQLINQTIRYTRSLSFELSPPILYDLGFEAAVEWLAEQLAEQQGVHFKVATDRSPKPLNDEIRVLLFQLLRELLNNMVKRAKPDHINVLISRNGSNLKVEIENDGIEIDLGAESPLPSINGLGLFSIRERLHHLGGNLEVEPTPGQGTRMVLSAPLKY